MKNEEITKPASFSLWAVGIITAIIAPLVSATLANYYGFFWAFGIGGTAVVSYGAVISLFLMVLLGSILGLAKNNKRAFGFLSAITTICFYVSGQVILYRFATYWGFRMSPVHKDTLGPLVPSFMMPSDPYILKPMEVGGGTLGAEWITPLLYWIIWSCIWSLYNVSIGLVVRQLFVKIEKLTFPTARVLTDTIECTTTNGRWGIFSKKNKLFWAGWILGFFALGYDQWIRQIPGLETIPVLTPGAGGFRTYELGPQLGRYLPGGAWSFGLEPALIAIAILMPVDILLSAAFFWLVKTIIDMAMVRAGMISYDPSWSGLTVMDRYGFVEGVRWFYIWWGALLGIAVMPLIIHRGYIIDTIKLALKRPAKSLSEDGEPFSYTVVYALLVISFLGYLALLLAGQAPLGPSLVYLIAMGISQLGWIRVMAEAGYHQLDMFREWLPVIGSVYSGPDVVNKTGTLVLYTNAMITGNWGSWHNIGPTSLQLSKVGESVNVHQRSVYTAIILSVIIGNAIGWPVTLYIFNTKGAANLRISGTWSWFTWFEAVLGTSQMVTEGTSWIDWMTLGFFGPQTLIGFVLSVAMSVARIMWPTFPISPIGLFIGASYHMNWVWFPVILGFIIKYIVLKIGGTILYEKKVVPIVIGVIVGYFVTSLVNAVLVIAKNPFYV